MLIDMNCLAEADHHVLDAHGGIARQKLYIAELKTNGRPLHAANALLALMNLTLPIIEDLRQQLLASMVSDKVHIDMYPARQSCGTQLILQVAELSESSNG